MVGRTCSPTCRPPPTRRSGRRWGDPDGGPTQLSIRAAALLSMDSCPTQHPDHALQVPLRQPWRRGEAGDPAPLPVRPPPSPRVGTQSHGCEPLARRVLLKGGVWPAGQGVLVRCLVPQPPVQPPCPQTQCPYAEHSRLLITQPPTDHAVQSGST